MFPDMTDVVTGVKWYSFSDPLQLSQHTGILALSCECWDKHKHTPMFRNVNSEQIAFFSAVQWYLTLLLCWKVFLKVNAVWVNPFYWNYSQMFGLTTITFCYLLNSVWDINKTAIFYPHSKFKDVAYISVIFVVRK